MNSETPKRLASFPADSTKKSAPLSNRMIPTRSRRMCVNMECCRLNGFLKFAQENHICLYLQYSHSSFGFGWSASNTSIALLNIFSALFMSAFILISSAPSILVLSFLLFFQFGLYLFLCLSHRQLHMKYLHQTDIFYILFFLLKTR